MKKLNTVYLAFALFTGMSSILFAEETTTPSAEDPNYFPDLTEEERAVSRRMGITPETLEVSAEDFLWTAGEFDMSVTTESESSDRQPYSVHRLEFTSSVSCEYPENNTAYGVWYEPVGGSDALMIFLPYWGGDNLMLESVIAGRTARMGINAVVMPLAYQFDRAPIIEGERVRSGSMTVSSDIVRTRSSWEQSCKDVQQMAWWFERTQGVTHPGLFGISLGAHVGAFTFGLSDRFEVGVFCLAGGKLHEMMWNDSVETRDIKEDWMRQGITYNMVERWMKPFDPCTYASGAVDRRMNILLVGGKTDPIVPPANVEALSDAFGGARIHWMESDHAGSMGLLMLQFRPVSQFIEEAYARVRANDREVATDDSDNEDF
ncbi:MAG: alpha/beta hydrolase [Planctomycetes bacterium]|nr:alpha/beta hydrolase [Planctomycetota bacterium]